MGKKSVRTRKQILEAAAICIAEKGIEATTTRVLARTARVSLGLVVYYIPKRKKLFWEVIRYVYQQVRESAREESLNLPPREKILGALRANFQEFDRAPHYYQCFLLCYYYSRFDKQIRKVNEQIYQNSVDRLTSYLKEEASSIGVKRSNQRIQKEAVAIAQFLEGALVFYSSIAHSNKAAYVRDFLQAQERRLDQFFS